MKTMISRRFICEIPHLLDNQDLIAHSFDVDELGFHLAMAAKDQVSTAISATKPGEFLIYCGVPGHKEAGMVATLIVEP